MASKAQIHANRANATHSTGPADTSRTRFNGLAHGLTSKQTVIRGENQAEYDAFAAGLRENLAPVSAVESLLADRVVAAAWRLQRFTRVETAFFNSRIDAILEASPGSDPDSALSALFTEPAEMARMRLFMRYQSSVQREYDTAMRELRKAKAERLNQENPQSAADPADLELARGLAELHQALDAPIGFASQPAQACSEDTTARYTGVK
jgi:hypothetical protein